MSKHDYTAEQALEVLLRKLKESNESLEATVRLAIDLGNDVIEVQRRGGRRVSKYRTVQFTHQEALQVAIAVLQAYFVDLPLCINSSIDNFRSAAVGPLTGSRARLRQEEIMSVPAEHAGDEKRLEIELQTVTQIFRTQQETLLLKQSDQQQIDNQSDHLKRLEELFDFSEDK